MRLLCLHILQSQTTFTTHTISVFFTSTANYTAGRQRAINSLMSIISWKDQHMLCYLHEIQILLHIITNYTAKNMLSNYISSYHHLYPKSYSRNVSAPSQLNWQIWAGLKLLKTNIPISCRSNAAIKVKIQHTQLHIYISLKVQYRYNVNLIIKTKIIWSYVYISTINPKGTHMQNIPNSFITIL